MRSVVIFIYAERKSIKRTNNKAVTPINEAQPLRLFYISNSTLGFEVINLTSAIVPIWFDA